MTAQSLLTTLLPLVADLSRELPEGERYRRLLEAMRAEAMRYGQQAQQIFDMFRQNPNMQAQLRAPIFEDKVVDLIVNKATVTDEKVSKEDLLKEDDMPDGYGA